MSSQGDGFDEWLEQALRREESALTGPHPLPAQARYQAVAASAGHPARLYRIGALASTKALVAVAVTVVTAAAAGGATEAVITGSINPSAWVQQGIAQVEKCSAALGGGGMGECANSFSLQRGNPRSGTQSAGPSNGHGGGPPTDKAVPPTNKGGPPTSKAGGPPTSHPRGGPTSTPPGQSSPGPHKSTPETGPTRS